MAFEWNEKRKMLVTLVTGLVINLGLVFLLYSARNDYNTKVTTLAGLKKQETELEKVVKRGPDVKLTLENFKIEHAKKEKMLPEEGQVSKLIDAVSAVANENKCIRKSLEFVAGTAGAQSGSNYTSDRWKTRWEADFFSFVKMVNQMEERFDRFVGFENLSISPKNNGILLSGATHEITVDVVTYRYTPK